MERRISHKRGLPPGTLVHIGERKAAASKVTLIQYSEEECKKTEIEDIDRELGEKEERKVNWLILEGIHEVENIGKIGRHLNLHPLVQEDILNTNQRPKIEDHDEYLFIVLKIPEFNPSALELKLEQLSLVLGAGFVATFEESHQAIFDPLKERILNGKGQIRRLGADYLAYALLDIVIDHYLVTLELIDDQLDELEDEMSDALSPEAPVTLKEVNKGILSLRRLIRGTRDVIGELQREESALVKASTRIYLRDAYDHTVQASETVEALRDRASDLHDIYLSAMSNRMNEVIKILTIIATIFIPLTFIASIYGMNFQHMPELPQPWAYPAILVFMLIIGLVMVAYFRKKRWL